MIATVSFPKFQAFETVKREVDEVFLFDVAFFSFSRQLPQSFHQTLKYNQWADAKHLPLIA